MYCILFDHDDDPTPGPAAETAWRTRYVEDVSAHTRGAASPSPAAGCRTFGCRGGCGRACSCSGSRSALSTASGVPGLVPSGSRPTRCREGAGAGARGPGRCASSGRRGVVSERLRFTSSRRGQGVR